MPVIKPILSFTLFLLLRRGVLFFIREKIYILKAPCSRNKHDFGRTFRKTVCRRLSVRQSCGASVAVQGQERGRMRRFHRTSRGGIRGAEVSRLRSGGGALASPDLGSCGRICVVLRWKPACVIWKGGRAQTGDVQPAGEENAAAVGGATGACGAGRACAMTCFRSFRAVLP